MSYDPCWLPFCSADIPDTLRTPPEVAAWELAQAGLSCALIRDDALGDGFAITEGGTSIRGGEAGLLYGTYRLLMNRQAGLPLAQSTETPAFDLRMLDCWDNLSGDVERGYAGRSLFFEGGRVTYDPARLRQYARLLASVGVNTLCVNNVNVVPPAHHLIDDELLPETVKLAAIFRPFGVKLMVSIDYAMPTYDGVPTADPLDERVQAWWSRQAETIYRAVPDLRGFLVKADSEHRPGPFTYGRDHAQGANLLARALRPFGGIVVWRCFVYNCKQDWRDTATDRGRAAYDHYAYLDGQFEDNVILQIKHGPFDFQVREPVSPLLLSMPRTRKAVEWQLAQEYTGQQIDLYAMQGLWNEGFADLTDAPNLTAVAAVANTGQDANWTGHPFAQFNLFAYGRNAWRPLRNFADELALWARLSYGLTGDALRTLCGLLECSREVYAKYTANLGLDWMVSPGHHYGPSPMGYEYTPWGTYHRANREAVGVDRTEKGTGYLSQYPEAFRARYRDPKTCPEELLLFFHRLRYDYVMKDGRTLIRRLYDDLREGAEAVEQMQAQLATLEGALPAQVFACASGRMARQAANAREWRDVITDFFMRLSGVPNL